MMRTTYERAALLLQVEPYDLMGLDHYKLMVVWQEDRHTIHEVHLTADCVYAGVQAGDRITITYLMDTPLRVALLANDTSGVSPGTTTD
jgi:hypothetical protein